MHRPVRAVIDPYQETDVAYLVVGLETTKPDIVEVDKDAPDSYRTLQEAKSFVLGTLRERIAEATESIDRVRRIGIELRSLM